MFPKWWSLTSESLRQGRLIILPLRYGRTFPMASRVMCGRLAESCTSDVTSNLPSEARTWKTSTRRSLKANMKRFLDDTPNSSDKWSELCWSLTRLKGHLERFYKKLSWYENKRRLLEMNFDPNFEANLLNTIKFSKNLVKWDDRLPESQYSTKNSENLYYKSKPRERGSFPKIDIMKSQRLREMLNLQPGSERKFLPTGFSNTSCTVSWNNFPNLGRLKKYLKRDLSYSKNEMDPALERKFIVSRRGNRSSLVNLQNRILESERSDMVNLIFYFIVCIRCEWEFFPRKSEIRFHWLHPKDAQDGSSDHNCEQDKIFPSDFWKTCQQEEKAKES